MLSGCTAAVNSAGTLVPKPSLSASSAVARTQKSVAMPTTVTSVTARERSHAASGMPGIMSDGPGSGAVISSPATTRPSKPEYAAS